MKKPYTNLIINRTRKIFQCSDILGLITLRHRATIENMLFNHHQNVTNAKLARLLTILSQHSFSSVVFFSSHLCVWSILVLLHFVHTFDSRLYLAAKLATQQFNKSIPYCWARDSIESKKMETFIEKWSCATEIDQLLKSHDFQYLSLLSFVDRWAFIFIKCHNLLFYFEALTIWLCISCAKKSTEKQQQKTFLIVCSSFQIHFANGFTKRFGIEESVLDFVRAPNECVKQMQTLHRYHTWDSNAQIERNNNNKKDCTLSTKQ